MKTKLLPLGFMLLAMNVFAEGGVGNGGGVHLCPDRSEQEMYDVYEGRTRYNLEIIDSNESVDAILAQALKKLTNENPSFAFEVKQQVNELMKSSKFRIIDRLKLTPIEDANILMVNEGCSYQQLANWDNVTDTVFVKNEYFKSFNNLNKAALYLHEAIYKVARVRASVKDSNTVRRLVAEILSTQEKLDTTFEQKTDFRVNNVHRPAPGGVKHSYSEVPYEELTVNLGDLTRESLKDSIGEVTLTVKETKDLKDLRLAKKQEYENARAAGISRRQLKELKMELDALNSSGAYSATFCEGSYPGCPYFAYDQITYPLADSTAEDLYLQLGIEGLESRAVTIGIKVELHDAQKTTFVETFKILIPKGGIKKKIIFRVNQNFQE